MQTAHCRFCNAEVVWAELANGKRIPIDPVPGFAGRYLLSQGQTGTTYARLIPKGEKVELPVRYRAHFASCPARRKVGV